VGWARPLAYITRTQDQDLLLRSEYLSADNRILKGQLLKGMPEVLTRGAATLGEIGHRVNRNPRHEVITAALPTLSWAGAAGSSLAESMDRMRVESRPPIGKDVEELIVHTAKENRSRGNGVV